jgi:hypothetical protein
MSGLSQNQIEFAYQVRALMERDQQRDPNLIARSYLQEAARDCYPQLAEADSRVVASYINANFKSANFNRLLHNDTAAELIELRAKVEKIATGVQDILAALDAIRK